MASKLLFQGEYPIQACSIHFEFTGLSVEIVSIYPVLSPPNLTPAQSNRVCNALALLQLSADHVSLSKDSSFDAFISEANQPFHYGLQCVASHPDTRMLFLNAHIPLYLYPFLNTTSKSRPFEYLRLTSLGVIGALVKVDDNDVINFLLSTEIIPLCLRTMEMGSELSKTVKHPLPPKKFSVLIQSFSYVTKVMAYLPLFQQSAERLPICSSKYIVATFIVQKILLDDMGLEYICTTAERFFAVGRVLGNMVVALAEQPSSRLLKHIIRCYLRLSDNPRLVICCYIVLLPFNALDFQKMRPQTPSSLLYRACDALRSCLPDILRDATTFSNCLHEDPTTRRWLQQLLQNVQGPRAPLQAGGGFDHMMVS
nr:cell differentiation protein RCD1 homolog [Ipomoea batatas]